MSHRVHAKEKFRFIHIFQKYIEYLSFVSARIVDIGIIRRIFINEASFSVISAHHGMIHIGGIPLYRILLKRLLTIRS